MNLDGIFFNLRFDDEYILYKIVLSQIVLNGVVLNPLFLSLDLLDIAICPNRL